jgi:hypothetical protein
VTFPEVDLSAAHNNSHHAHHVAQHDLYNELVADGVVGDQLAKVVAGTSTVTVQAVQALGAVSGQIQSVTHSTAGGVYIGLFRHTAAVKITATANITELRLQDLWEHGPLATELPVMIHNNSAGTITINLNGVETLNPPPASLAAEGKWVFWVCRHPRPANFQVVDYFETFDTVGPGATVLNSTFWEIYDSSTGNDGWGVRRPSAVAVVAEATATSGPNVLRITASNGVGGDTGKLVSGGIKLLVPQVYCQVEIRVRVADDADQVTSGVVLLWPKTGPRFPTEGDVWPAGGEIDIWEGFNNRATRTPYQSYLHRLNPAAVAPFDAADDEVLQFDWTGVDGSAWHKLTFTWTPALLSLSIDDGPHQTLSSLPAWIPGWPMELCFQLDPWPAPATPTTQPALTAGTRTMDVDYVLVRQFT